MAFTVSVLQYNSGGGRHEITRTVTVLSRCRCFCGSSFRDEVAWSRQIVPAVAREFLQLLGVVLFPAVIIVCSQRRLRLLSLD